MTARLVLLAVSAGLAALAGLAPAATAQGASELDRWDGPRRVQNYDRRVYRDFEIEPDPDPGVATEPDLYDPGVVVRPQPRTVLRRPLVVRRYRDQEYFPDDQDQDQRVQPRTEDFDADEPAPGDGKPEGVTGGPRPYIAAVAPPRVAFSGGYMPGSIVIDTSRRKLYYVTGPTSAYAYPIGVGREGFSWTGTQKVSRIADWPDWYPPAEMRQRKPELPERMLGGLNNPLGAKAIYLGNTLYRIHGTNEPKSIGGAQSSGCFRMLNSHVLHLASLVQVGAEVSVVHSLGSPKPVAAAAPQPAAKPKPVVKKIAAKPAPVVRRRYIERYYDDYDRPRYRRRYWDDRYYDGYYR